ncbi:hypothetical protein AB205_0004430 [Aquarana catesbeiana]|uniref:Uncharacterized protein n=1 Tax=Aquarana catesbeiana TaxID=8400 RepID=A0A2G9S470_AQUCT|nr:hypothetical protein AB205_0004430 [Aquarana catesbeiana]
MASIRDFLFIHTQEIFKPPFNKLHFRRQSDDLSIYSVFNKRSHCDPEYCLFNGYLLLLLLLWIFCYVSL